MKLPQNKYIKWNYLALAFLIPVLLFMGVMLFGSYEPFGNNRSMLYSDMYHQYYPFFVEFRNALRSGDSLLYSWSIGMGFDYLVDFFVLDSHSLEHFSGKRHIFIFLSFVPGTLGR